MKILYDGMDEIFHGLLKAWKESGGEILQGDSKEFKFEDKPKFFCLRVQRDEIFQF